MARFIDLQLETEYNESGEMSLFERLHWMTYDLPASWITQLTFQPLDTDSVRITSDNSQILDSLLQSHLESLED